MIKKALISVSDKTGIVEFGKDLDSLGIEIISTGGTAKALSDAGIKVTNVSDITGFPECLNGRVKTLHPKIHGGLLAVRDNAEHMKQLRELGIDTIDMVVINLYPFKQTIMKPGVTLEEAIENIDIGGPTMLRSAAKNYQGVTVVVDPGDYERVLEEIRANGDTKLDTRYGLALKVFEHTGQYDAMIAHYLRSSKGLDKFPQKFTITFEKIQDMRYGENPHQTAAFYREVLPVKGSIAQAVQLHGKELSFNNINDTNGALDLLREFEEPTIVGVKHANPCGVGSADNIYDAYMKAYEADPVSIFGGIIASNREIDERTAAEINKIFIEIVIAPSFSQEALSILKAKKNIRLLQLEEITAKLPDTAMDMKKVGGGLLVQDIDNTLIDMDSLEVVTKRKPTDKEMEDLIFAWKVVKHTKSNGIAICKDKQSLGIGPGQVNRIWATTQAVERSGQRVKGAVLASDAFFPFPDSVEAAGKAGITAIIQPGGSLKDNLSIEKADEFGIAMVFTKMRHFKH